MLQTLLWTVALVGAAGLLSTATGSRWPMALLMVLLLGRGVLNLDWRREIFRPYRALRPRHFLIALPTLGLPLVAFLLFERHPILGWSLLSLVGQEGGNVAAVGLQLGWLFALPYLVLLLAALPTLALIEEYWFRRGTRGWADGLLRSLLFGLVHLLVGVPLGVALFGLSGAGLVFTAVYRRASRAPAPPGRTVFALDRFPVATPAEGRGMDASALQHLAYNTVALLIGAIGLLLYELGV